MTVGPGTLYNLLEQFEGAGMIRQTRVDGRRRSYQITRQGLDVLENEYQRLMTLTGDYRRCRGEGEGNV